MLESEFLWTSATEKASSNETSIDEVFGAVETRLKITGVYAYLKEKATALYADDPSTILEFGFPKRSLRKNTKAKIDLRFGGEEIIPATYQNEIYKKQAKLWRSKGIRVEVDAGYQLKYYYADSDPSARRKVERDVRIEALKSNIYDKRKIMQMQREELERQELLGWRRFRTDLPLKEAIDEVLGIAGEKRGYFDYRTGTSYAALHGTSSNDLVTKPIELQR